MEVLDTAGQEELASTAEQYYRTGQGFIFVYSITSRQSFDQLKDRFQAVSRAKDATSFPVVLVGNKSDLESERQVSTEEGRELAKSFGATFLETSAKNKTNVEESFHAAVRLIRKDKEKDGGNAAAPAKKKCVIS
eukprot:TRINITY_DN1561_c0_g1_i2.p1 TRINITY_DN1561_c0_g1~~TRINITY_DN1561_c0_g1_i2.p1  ORF type:complete len:135 (-),score=30.41 TRINITY_DN1561_c0_g1_i2:43-447(-)